MPHQLDGFGDLPVPLAESKTRCAPRNLGPSTCAPTGSICTGPPGCKGELWDGPSSAVTPKSPWRSRLRPRALCLSSQGSIAGLWERHLQREELRFVPQRRQLEAASLAGVSGGCSRGRGLCTQRWAVFRGDRHSCSLCSSAGMPKSLCYRVTNNPPQKGEEFRCSWGLGTGVVGSPDEPEATALALCSPAWCAANLSPLPGTQRRAPSPSPSWWWHSDATATCFQPSIPPASPAPSPHPSISSLPLNYSPCGMRGAGIDPGWLLR